MKSKIKILIESIIVVLLLFGCSLKNSEINDTEKVIPTEKIPSSALQHYNQEIGKKSNTLGVTIQECIKDDILYYIVDGSGGYTGISYYYTAEGMFLGAAFWSDDFSNEGENQEPPVDLYGYECGTIKSSQ